MSLPTSRKKRVRFRDDAEVRHYEPESPKRVRMTEKDPMESLECALQPGLAPPGDSAAEPACARRSSLTDLFLPECDDAADADADWDVLQPSEADYDDPAELLTASGIPIEPFNLKEEREEGYFDRESGGYVRLRRRDAVDDAWADALAATEVDAGWAAAVLAGRRRQTAVEDAAGCDDHERSHDHDNIVHLKHRIAALLLPGENSLAGLRRLGRSRVGGGAVASSSVVRGRVGLTPEARSEFDRLTEYSAALMEAGEYMAHSMTREELLGGNQGSGTIDRGLEDPESGGERLAEALLKAAMAGETNGTTDRVPQPSLPPLPLKVLPSAAAEADVDMFAADGDQSEEKTTEIAAAAAPGKRPDVSQQQCTTDAPPLQGFVLDAATGYFYNSQMGAYYDPRSRQFGDAASGTWWRLDAATGRYVAA